MTSPTAIRDALLSRVPTGPNFILDVKVHDGVADMTVQCGGQRWCSAIATGGRVPDAVADIAEAALLDWVNASITAMVDADGVVVAHKYRRAARGFSIWLKGDPSARTWLGKHRKDGAIKRLVRDYQPEAEAA